MSPPDHPSNVVVHAISVSDSLGYLGQHTVAQAMGRESQYLIVGGHMVQLLLHVYPTPEAITRTTKDADTALGDIDLVLPLTQNLLAEDFAKEGATVSSRRSPPTRRSRSISCFRELVHRQESDLRPCLMWGKSVPCRS